ATLLKPRGYATAAFVGAFPVHSRFGLNQGFDVYDDRVGDTRAPDELALPESPASEVVPLARQWIAERREAGGAGRAGRAGGDGGSGSGSGSGSWFIWIHLFDPHTPYRPPAPFDAQYASQPYYGEVAATDAALAPLLDDLRATAQPTLVIVTGDHGESLGDHGEQTHGTFAYEATLRVPLIVTELGTQRPQSAQSRKPHPFLAGLAGFAFQDASAAGGEVASVAARHVDILPTILAAVG